MKIFLKITWSSLFLETVIVRVPQSIGATCREAAIHDHVDIISQRYVSRAVQLQTTRVRQGDGHLDQRFHVGVRKQKPDTRCAH